MRVGALHAADVAMSKKIRVAVYITVSPDWGGSFQYAESILDALAMLPKEKFTIRIWCHHLKEWSPIFANKKFTCINSIARRSFMEKVCYRVFRLFEMPVLNTLRLHRLWRFFSPDTVPVHWWEPDICVFTQQSFTDLPQTTIALAPIHDLMHKFFPQFPEVGELAEAQGREHLFNTIAGKSHGILADSQVGKEHILQFYPEAKGKVHILPFIPPRSLLEANPVKPACLPDSFTKRFLFYPAQFWLHKNHLNLLNALNVLVKDLDIHCVFSGGTTHNGYEPVVSAIRTLELAPHVTVLGYVTNEELSWLYQNAYCMVMPTFFGPTNIPPLEAMFFGCPMALSGNFGMPEQCKDAALYFDPSSVDDIAKTIRRIWEDDTLHSALSAHGKQQSKAWQPADFEKRFLEIFHTLLSTNRPTRQLHENSSR